MLSTESWFTSTNIGHAAPPMRSTRHIANGTALSLTVWFISRTTMSNVDHPGIILLLPLGDQLCPVDSASRRNLDTPSVIRNLLGLEIGNVQELCLLLLINADILRVGIQFVRFVFWQIHLPDSIGHRDHEQEQAQNCL